jgi:hypothetical protein
LGDCSTKITGEHWISRNVLEYFTSNGVIKIGGVPWLTTGQIAEIPIDVLQSNVLCDRHNPALSPLDSVAKRFFGALPNVKGSWSQLLSLNLFCGIDFERWMLKLLCGIVYAGVLHSPAGRLRDWKPPPTWLECLYSGSPLAAPRGLYLATKQGPADFDRQFALACVAKNDDVYGLIIEVCGLPFVLSLQPPASSLPPDSLLAGAVVRPSSLVFSHPKGQTVFVFDWGPVHQGDTVNINFLVP